MTPVPHALPRRTVLAVSGTAVLAAAAACSSAAPTAESAASSATGSVREQVSSASGTGQTSADGTPTAPTGTPLASVASVESASSVVIGEDKNAVLLASSNGTVVAHTAVCTHQGCIIAASGECPCHQSRFNVTTGAVINGPAQQPLAEVPVAIFQGQVYKA